MEAIGKHGRTVEIPDQDVMDRCGNTISIGDTVTAEGDTWKVTNFVTDWDEPGAVISLLVRNNRCVKTFSLKYGGVEKSESQTPDRPDSVSEPDGDWEERESPALALFLDLLAQDIEQNPDRLAPYTEEEGQQDKALVEGVVIDDEEWEREQLN